MKNKPLIFGSILVALVVIILVSTNMRTARDADTDQDIAPVPTTSATFYDESTGTKVDATFTDTSVTFTHQTLGTMTLPQAVSASGARYATADESIVFWNKGNDLFITQDGKIVFEGSTEQSDTTAATPSQGKLPAGSTPPGTAAQLRANTWVWVETQMNDGSVTKPNKPGVFTLSFGVDGRVSGKTDCNGFGGTYEIGSDGKISFGPFMSTLMYCEGSQENIYSKQIADSTSYMIDAKGNLVLMIKYDSGSIIFKKQ